MTQETLKKMYQLLLTEPHAETVCFKLEAIAREALAQPPLPVQPEPVAWDKTSASFDEWWDSDRHDNANPFDTDSFAYWAWEGWQAALTQRPWVGLTGLEQKAIMAMNSRNAVFETEAKLKEKNHG